MCLEGEEVLTVGLKERIFSFKSKSKYKTVFLLVERINANVYPAYKASNKRDRNCLHRLIYDYFFLEVLLMGACFTLYFIGLFQVVAVMLFWLVRLQSK